MKQNERRQHIGKNLFEGHLAAFSCWLGNKGCSAKTIGTYLGVCRKFGRYLDNHDIVLEMVHDGHLNDFLKQVKPRRGSIVESCKYHQTGIRRLLDYLQDAAICPTPLDPYLEGYKSWLTDRGYAEKTVTKYVWTCRHLGRYLRRESIELCCISEEVLETFLQQLQMKRARRVDKTIIRRDYRRRLKLLIMSLCEKGACPALASPVPEEPPCVSDYLEFLRNHRGLCGTSIENQKRTLMRFLAHTGLEGTTEQLRFLSAQQADDFLVEVARCCKRTSMGHFSSTLRGFFRFLNLSGVLSTNLSQQVTTPRIYRQEGVPRAASWADVERTLEVIDRSTLVGRRDYAILSLLAYYGLRASEVAKLCLDDLDWRNDIIHVHRAKGGDTDALPLLTSVGNALVDYLEIRPVSEYLEVFLKVIAPSGPISSASVSWLARKYLLAAGVEAPLLGAHTLRHSHAIRLLRAGFPLKTIGDTLGHRNPQSTFIYTKVATEDLRTVALDIDEVRP